jgi:hypothetical protein
MNIRKSLLVLGILFIAAGCTSYNQTTSTLAVPAATDTSKIDWKTYTLPQYGLSIQYPADATVHLDKPVIASGPTTVKVSLSKGWGDVSVDIFNQDQNPNEKLDQDNPKDFTKLGSRTIGNLEATHYRFNGDEQAGPDDEYFVSKNGIPFDIIVSNYAVTSNSGNVQQADDAQKILDQIVDTISF